MIDGIDYGPLAILVGVWKGDQMHYSESTFLSIYDRKECDHKDLNTLQRVG